ncbi:hypothetical protein NMG60_11008395 [Bertholletia excelsa]
MGSDGAGEDSHPEHAVQIWEVKPDRLAAMHEKISATPKMLSKWAGHPSCSIFRVPQSLININGRSYHPHIPHLQMIQEHKWRFLAALLRRTQSRGLELEDYLKAIYPLEPEVRECYSEVIHLTTDEFTELLVLDGCFIIELFRKYGKVVPELFDLTRMPGEESGPSLSDLALGFFNNTLQRPDEPEPSKSGSTRVIQCISKLRRAGIKLKPNKAESFLTVRFRRGVIEMPTGRGYLSDCSIIENYFGTDAEVARFINNLGKDVTFDIDKCYLARLFDEWAGFRYRYFRSPWSFISALAAFVLLVLSVLQTYYTMIGHLRPGRSGN